MIKIIFYGKEYNGKDGCASRKKQSHDVVVEKWGWRRN
jgi:hypothetical protein